MKLKLSHKIIGVLLMFNFLFVGNIQADCKSGSEFCDAASEYVGMAGPFGYWYGKFCDYLKRKYCMTAKKPSSEPTN